MPEIEPTEPQLKISDGASTDQQAMLKDVAADIYSHTAEARKAINFYTYSSEAVEKVYEFLGDSVEKFKLLGRIVLAEKAGAIRHAEFDETTEDYIDGDKAHAELVKSAKADPITGAKKVRLNRLSKFAELVKRYGAAKENDGNAA